MGDVTQILSQIEAGHGQAAGHLLPLVYDELRRLAAAKMAGESPNQTLQATGLVHEAYLRLVDHSHPDSVEKSRPFLLCRGGSDAPDLGGTGTKSSISKAGGRDLP